MSGSNMLHPENLHAYQVRAIEHTIKHPHGMLHLDMGLGKTIIALSAIQHMQEFGGLGPVLIVAPLRVALTVWAQEAQDWSHTRGLTCRHIVGDAEQRMRALFTPADVYIINYENLQWLQAQLEHFFLRKGNYPPFQMIVWDEVDKMKDASSKRVQAMRKLIPFIPRRVGLTGTPAASGIQDLFGQYLIVDGGARLGTSKDLFMQRFFDKQGRYGYRPYANTLEHVTSVVSDITMQMRAEDYLEVPDLVINDVWVELPERARQIYDELEQDFFAELDSGAAIELSNEGSKINKCLQVANGAVYLVPGEPEYEVIHTAKLDAWMEIREGIGDEPLLSAYAYRFDYLELEKRVPTMVNMTTLPKSQISDTEARFNAGVIRDMIGAPASIGHGLNLQKACNQMAMIGVPWSLRLYQQFIARLRRQGQKQHKVVLHRILAKDTFDEVVLASLANNDATQEAVRDSIQRYRQARVTG